MSGMQKRIYRLPLKLSAIVLMLRCGENANAHNSTVCCNWAVQKALEWSAYQKIESTYTMTVNEIAKATEEVKTEKHIKY